MPEMQKEKVKGSLPDLPKDGNSRLIKLFPLLQCDTALPRCKTCEMAGQPCTMVDAISKREYERACVVVLVEVVCCKLMDSPRYVTDLERRIRELEAQLQLNSVENLALAPTNTGDPSLDEDASTSRSSPHQSATSQYVGDSSEIKYVCTTSHAPCFPTFTNRKCLMSVLSNSLRISRLGRWRPRHQNLPKRSWPSVPVRLLPSQRLPTSFPALQ